MIPKFLETSGEGPRPQLESSLQPLVSQPLSCLLKGPLHFVAERASALGVDKTHPDGALPLTSPAGPVPFLNVCLLLCQMELRIMTS